MNATVINASEINRMRSSLNVELGGDAFRASQNKKTMLRTLSQDRIKSWPNTLEALRRKKEEFVKTRAHEEELERREVDRKEAELNRKLRFESLERASEMLFKNTDKMKLLKSQIMYADAIHGRKDQIAWKQKVKEDIKKEDEVYHNIKMEKVRRSEEEDEAKARKKEKVMEAVKLQREEQIAQVRAERKREADEAMAIGAAMRRRAEAQVQEDIQASIDKQAMIDKKNADMVIANEKFKAIKASVRKREEEEEARRDAEVAGIEFRKQARKDLAARHAREKQAQRQKIIDDAVTLLAKQNAQHAQIAEKQAAEARDKADKAEAAKEARRQKLWNAIVESRTEMINKKVKDWEKEQEHEIAMAENWKKVINEEHFKREERDRKIHEQNMVIKKIQKAEGIENARRKVREKLEERERDAKLRLGGNEAEEKFYKVCRETIAAYAKEGKPTYTLYKALERSEPVLLPAILNPEKRGKKDED